MSEFSTIVEQLETTPDTLKIFNAHALSFFDMEKPQLRQLTVSEHTNIMLGSLKAGQHIPEHTSPRRVLIQVVRGMLEMQTPDRIALLEPGMLVQLAENIPHSVTARMDTIILVTLY